MSRSLRDLIKWINQRVQVINPTALWVRAEVRCTKIRVVADYRIRMENRKTSQIEQRKATRNRRNKNNLSNPQKQVNSNKIRKIMKSKIIC